MIYAMYNIVFNKLNIAILYDYGIRGVPGHGCRSTLRPQFGKGGLMNSKSPKLKWIIGTAFLMLFVCNIAVAQDLLETKCGELMRMAETYQQDLRTVDAVLGAAIDGGDMDRIRSYKLRKGAVKSQLDSVLKAIDLKGCAKGR
jgi:hypothetical protein